MVERFDISKLSHDLHSPLDTLQSILASLLSGSMGEFTKDQRKYLEMANEEAQKEDRMIDDLLDLLRSNRKEG